MSEPTHKPPPAEHISLGYASPAVVAFNWPYAWAFWAMVVTMAASTLCTAGYVATPFALFEEMTQVAVGLGFWIWVGAVALTLGFGLQGKARRRAALNFKRRMIRLTVLIVITPVTLMVCATVILAVSFRGH